MSVAIPPFRSDRVKSPPVYQFTIKQYHRMVQMGILTANDHVELLEGCIVPKIPHNPPHEGTITRATRRLMPMLPPEWLLRVQSAITLRRSEPEPDLAIVRGPEEIYFLRHPRPRDIALLIEVADSTLLHDRRRKGAIYASARIPQYWIINLVDATIEVYTEPRAGKFAVYRGQRIYETKESVPFIVDARELGKILASQLLPSLR